MLANTRLFLGAALLVAAGCASAATQTTVGFDSTRADRVTAEQTSHSKVLMNRSSNVEAKSGNSINSATPSLPRFNPLTPYPPSCLADPLPDQTSGPVYSKNVSLAAFNENTHQIDSTEIVTIKIWRVACSNGQFYNSATLMRIDRNSNSTTIYPVFPSIRVKQGSGGFDSITSLARVAVEPNTWISDVYVDTPVIYDTTFVLENYDSTQTSIFDYNLPFSVQFNNLFASNNLFYIDVPAYIPTTATYPAAFENIPISGYLSSNWYDPTADGEGIVLQVYELKNDPQKLTVALGWFAFDPAGLPFWIFGQADIPRGAKVANVSMVYLTGGGLGGSGGAANVKTWGSATISFADCDNMNFSYASNAGLPAGVPQGSRSNLQWIRIASVNALACQ